MYTIFFHVSGLAIIEILFYFMYIGPMETKIFNNAIGRVVHTSNHNLNVNIPIHIVDPFNSSNTITIDTINNEMDDHYLKTLKEDANNAKSNRDEKNQHLFRSALTYWSFLATFSFISFVIEMSIKYYMFKRKKALGKSKSLNDMEIEMMDRSRLEEEPLRIRGRLGSQDNDDSRIESSSSNNEKVYLEEEFINWHELRKTIIYTSLYYTVLTAFILGFEYLFFTYIILKYDIISIEEMKYALYRLVQSYINQYIEDYSLSL